jgi:hypothetical protein
MEEEFKFKHSIMSGKYKFRFLFPGFLRVNVSLVQTNLKHFFATLSFISFKTFSTDLIPVYLSLHLLQDFEHISAFIYYKTLNTLSRSKK